MQFFAMPLLSFYAPCVVNVFQPAELIMGASIAKPLSVCRSDCCIESSFVIKSCLLYFVCQ